MIVRSDRDWIPADYESSVFTTIVSRPTGGQNAIYAAVLVKEFSAYGWTALRDDIRQLSGDTDLQERLNEHKVRGFERSIGFSRERRPST